MGTDNLRADAALKARVDKLKIHDVERHIFICTGAKCAPEGDGLRTWDYVKARLKELGLAEGKVFRTKSACLRICQAGPTALVYPEGAWYRDVTVENAERIIQQHLIHGEIVEELLIARRSL